MYTLTEWGISNEPVEEFAARNRFKAQPVYPQDCTRGREVNRYKGLPFLPITGFEDADWEKMHFEASRLSKHYVPHRHHESHHGWASLCIHGLSSVHTEAHHTYGFERENAPYRWTDVADWCPTIRDFFENRFDYHEFDRIRIMKLSPGGYIIPHKDSITEDEDHIGPTNIALNNPEDCNFYMDDIGILPFEQGRVMKLNLYNVHAVFNHSNEDRYHVIVHGRAGDSWEDRIFDSYNHWRDVYV
jgi:hypothetical protein